MKTISIVNNKGGVAKTTTAMNLGYEFSQHNDKRVLLVDLDPQTGNLSRFMGVGENSLTVADVLMGGTYIKNAIQPTSYERLDILAANEDLESLYKSLDGIAGGEEILRNALEAVNDDYDYCIIDNAPAKTIITKNSLVASSEVIVPICIDPYSLWGLTGITKSIQEARTINPELYFLGCLITRYVKDPEGDKMKDEIEIQDNYPVCPTKIRESKKAIGSALDIKPVTEGSFRSSTAVDYRKLAREYLNGDLHSL